MGFVQDFEYEKQWLTPTALQGIDMYKNGGYINPPLPSFPKTYEQEKRVSELSATINSYFSDVQQQWILGTGDIDSQYDEFIQTLRQMNIDELVQIHQKAYDTMRKKN